MMVRSQLRDQSCSFSVWLALELALMPLSTQVRADPILDWTDPTLDCIRADNSAPTLGTRNLAILHTDMYDAVNSITRTHQPYLFQLDAPAGTSIEAAAVGAAYEVMLALYPSFEFWADDLYDTWFSTTPHADALTTEFHLRARIGLLALDSRSADGASTEVPYIPGKATGQWQRTPPFFRPPLTPHWRYVNTFCLTDLDPFAPGPPRATRLRPLAARTVPCAHPSKVRLQSSGRTTATRPCHRGTGTKSPRPSRRTGATPWKRMRASSPLLSLAQADAAIVCWEARYRYNLWRPKPRIVEAEFVTRIFQSGILRST